MKNKGVIIFFIVLFFLIAILLLSILIYSFNIGKINISKKDLILTKSYSSSYNDVENIDIKLISTDIKFIKSKDNNIKIDYYDSDNNKNKEIELKKVNNTILFNVKLKNNSCFLSCHYKSRAFVYLPKNYKGKINVKTISGNIKILENINNSIKIESISGDVNALNFNNDVNIKTNSGDIEVKEINKKLNIKTVSGDINIDKLNINKDSKIESISGDTFILNNQNKCFIDYKTTSGDANIKSSNRYSNVSLFIKTISGDISVN